MKLSDLSLTKGEYLAFVLSERSRAAVLKTITPQYSRVICHHVTIDFNPTPEKLSELQAAFGDHPSVEIYGIAQEDGVQCAAVRIGNLKERMDGSFYHVTISVEPPKKPVDSNKLKDKVDLIRGRIVLEGEIKMVKK